MINRILIVCIGNICRSPMAEHLLREALAPSAIEIRSAGLAALVDEPIEATARIVLESNGHSSFRHRARQFTRKSASDSELILVMEQHHVERVLKLAPEARGKVFLFGKWQGEREIADPYRKGESAFRQTYLLIDEGVQAWRKRLASSVC